MTTQEIADRIVALNRENNHAAAYDEFYTDETVSIENWSAEPMVYKGLAAIHEKAKKWEESVEELRSVTVSEPLVSDSSFAITFIMDITYKDANMPSGIMTELGIYTVKDGKIVSEEFRG